MKIDNDFELYEYERKNNDILNDKIDYINKIYDMVDGLEFLSYLSYIAGITFDNEKGYTHISPVHFEYLVGIFLSKEYNTELKGKGNLQDSDNVVRILDEMIAAWKISNSFRKVHNKKSEDDLRLGLFEASIISNYGSIRGYSWYTPYMDNQYKHLFSKFNVYLKDKIGFTIDQVFEYIDVLKKLYILKGDEIKSAITQNILEYNAGNNESSDEIVKKSTFNVNYKEIMFFSLDDIASIDKNIDICSFKNFLDRFSTIVGEDGNKDYKYLSDKNDYRWKPILKYNEKYFVQSTTKICWILKDELEEDLRVDSKVWKKYQEHKANYLEEETLKIFKNTLPNSNIYQSLYYKIDGQRYELDGLVVYDSNILLIEAKSGIYHKSARRGGIKRLEKNIYENIEFAFEQANRCRNYILNCNEIIFEDEKGNEIVNIKQDLYQNIFILNVTLEHFSELSIDLYQLRELNLYKSNEFPWSVTLSDLAIISEFIKFPTQFIHYILFRTRFNNVLNKNDNIKLTYELDLLGLYLTEESQTAEEYLIEDIDIDNLIINMMLNTEYNSNCLILDYSKIFNKYYNSIQQGNDIDTIEKYINPEIYNMVRQVEGYDTYGYSNFALKFLDLSIEEQEKLIEYIEKACSRVKKDGNDHNITIPFMRNRFDSTAGYGITIEAATSKYRDSILNNFNKFCIIKRAKSGVKEWIGLCSFVDDNRHLVNNFVFIRDDEKNDESLNRLIKDFPEKKLKISRNSLCPCGSGKKYKKCHGLK